MFYLEDEKTLVLTNENKKDILNALTKINQVSNNKNIKVAYIKILGKVLEFNNSEFDSSKIIHENKKQKLLKPFIILINQDIMRFIKKE